MFEAGYLILESLYQAGGKHAHVPISLSAVVVPPGMAKDDLRLHVGDLAAQGLVEVKAGTITVSKKGVRALYIRTAAESRLPGDEQIPVKQDSQDIPIEAPVEEEADDGELDLGSIMDLVQEARTRPDSGVMARGSPAAQGATDRVDVLRRELNALTRDLALASHLNESQWEQALDLTEETQKLLEALARLLRVG